MSKDIDIDNNEKDDDINFIYPAFPSLKNKTFPVDFATNSISNVFLNDANEYECISRTDIPHKFRSSKFHYTFPSLPLCPPNNTLFAFEENHVGVNYVSRGSETLHTQCVKHYNAFACSHHDILYKSLKNLNFPLDHQKKWRNTILCDEKPIASFRRKISSLRKVVDIYDNVCDIPYDILVKYIDESMFIEYDTYKYNPNIRNCLTYTILSDISFVIAVQGKFMNCLNVYKMVIDEGDEVIAVLVCSHELIYQIKSVKKYSDDIFIIHGDYHMTVVQLVLADNDTFYFERRYEKQFDIFVNDISVNPECYTDYFIVSNNGNLACVQGNNVMKTPLHNYDVNSDDVSKQWSASCYGAFQQTCLVVNPTSVVLYDFRVVEDNPTIHFELPCHYFNRHDSFTPCIQWSAHNTHHYYVGSSQSLVICDDRYLKTPVMKVNHYLEGEPRYLNITELETDNYLVSMTTYNKSESVCMNFMMNHAKTNEKIGNCNVKIAPCINVREPLFKLSSYMDWKSYVSEWQSVLPSIEKRISSPCIGLTICPVNETNTNTLFSCQRKYYCVQSNIYGDLFCHVIRYNNDEVNSDDIINNSRNNLNKPYVEIKNIYDDKTLELKGRHKEMCKTWLENLQSVYFNEDDCNSIDNKLKSNGSKDLTNCTMKLTREEHLSKISCSDFQLDENDIKGESHEIPGHYDTVVINGALIFDERYFESNDMSDEDGEVSDRKQNGGRISDIKQNSDRISEKKLNNCQIPERQFNEDEISDSQLNDSVTLDEDSNNEQSSHNDSTTSETSDAIVVDINRYKQLRNDVKHAKSSCTILKRKSLKLNDITTTNPLCLVSNIEGYTKPLSTLLFKNWSSDKSHYTTLDVVAPYTAFDPALSVE